MAKDNLPKAQVGTSIPRPQVSNPMLDEGFMEQRYGGYRQSRGLPSVQIPSPTQSGEGSNRESAVSNFEKNLGKIPSGKGVGPVTRTGDQYIGSDRYDYFNPEPSWDNEDSAAQGQGWGSQMVNGVAKGLALTATTLLQNTVGLVNGIYQATSDGRLASFYDNDFNNALDKMNKSLEDSLPNYYTRAERDAKWYSPTYWATGNFLWDGVVKNMGFAAGTYLSAGVYTSALKSLPLASKLFSTGKAAETIAATEAGLAGGGGSSAIFGELKGLSDSFLKTAGGYNTLNKGQRYLVAGLSTTGEAGFEALHNANEFRQELISKYEQENGVVATGKALDEINRITDAAANKALFANIGLLTATNYIQLPKILGSSYGSEKTLLNGLGRKTNDIVFDAVGKASPKAVSRLGRVVNAIRKPYLFSWSEAFEESSQFAVGVATKDYYNKAYNGEATSWISSIGTGITEGMFSDEGAKNALIGGLSGSIMLNVLPSVRSMVDKNYETSSQRLRRQTDEAVRQFNSSNLPAAVQAMNFDLSNFTTETQGSVNRMAVLQKERQEALKNGDIFQSKNIEADYIINYLTPRIKYGRFDLVKDDISRYKDLATGDFSQLQEDGIALQTDTKDAFLARLNRFEQTAEAAQSLYQSINLRFGSQFQKNEDGDVILDEKGNPKLAYPSSVIDQMMYAALKTEDFDQRILTLSNTLSTQGINVTEVLDSVVNGDFKAANEAAAQIQSLDILQDKKDKLGSFLNDIVDAAAQRQTFIKTYKDIQDNPNKYASGGNFSQDAEGKPYVGTYVDDEEDKETVTVQTQQGKKEVEVSTEYFVGNSVEYNEENLGDFNKIGQFSIKETNKDGTIKIVDSNTGQERDISPEVFKNFKIGKVSTLRNNKKANFYYTHRNEVFELNRGKNYGGRVKGRLEYETIDNDNGILYFVYKTQGGKLKKKQVEGGFFVPLKGFNEARLKPVGLIRSESQRSANEEFTSPTALAKQRKTLAKNRQARLEVLTQLGEEGKENIVELDKIIEKASKDSAKVKEDLANIRKMKKTGPDGPKIKLNFSKATRSFTRTINNLTRMRKDLNKTIKLAEIERDEVLNDISYFEQYANEISDAPENSGEFLKELKDQIKILADNGKNLAKIIKAAKKMGTTLRQVTKRAASLFRKAIKSTYIIDDDYAKSLNDLLDDVASGEDLDVTWPALKQKMLDFQLTNDISKDVNFTESDIIRTRDEVSKLEDDIKGLREEYRARKKILDRFQSIMDEYNAQKSAAEKLARDQKLLTDILNTSNSGQPLVEYVGEYSAVKRKRTDIVPVAAIPQDKQDYQDRVNEFGVNLNSFENRNDIRGIYLTKKTQDQLLDGVVEKVLDESEELIEKFGDTAIVMVVVNENGELVGVDGQPIAEGESLLDNAIYQVMPEANLENSQGSMFRENTDQSIIDSIKEQYSAFRSSVLAQESLGVAQEIEASFGVPDVSATLKTSVQDAGLIDENMLEKDPLIVVGKGGEVISQGTTSYDNTSGKAFLKLPNGYVPLKNRKFTKQEANTIFDAIVELSKNIVDGKGVDSDSSIDLLNYLKRVTYWGIPRDGQTGERKTPGRNSVFFQRTTPEEGGELQFTKLELVVGNSINARFDFAPSDLEMNRDVIIELLENTYNNVNALDKILMDVNTPFEEIVEVKDGEIESVTWPNYQSYLLSNKNPDGTDRTSELPLYTTISPKVEGEVNRKSIYLYSKTGQDNYMIESPAVEEAEEEAPLTIKDGKVIVPKKYVLDGSTVNTYTSAKGSEIRFAFDSKVADPSPEKIKVLKGGDLQDVIKKIQPDYKEGDDIAESTKSQIAQTIWLAIEKQVAKEKSELAFQSNVSVADAAVEVGSKYGSMFDDEVSPEPTQQTSEVEVVTYKGTKYSVDFNVGSGTITNLKTGKVLEGGITSPIGQAVVDLAIDQQDSTQQTEGGLNFQEDIDDAIADMNDEHFREVIEQEMSLFEPENWNDVDAWMKKNLPNVPLNRVQNFIRAGEGRLAYGMFKDNAIYVYENAEVGTTYHEAFEAVFNSILSPEEKSKLRTEFNSRKGTFVDRPTGQTVKFSEATGQQAKEQLAEEFRDYVQDNVKPKGVFARIFKQLKELIEKLFLSSNSDNLAKELFKKIDTGFYSDAAFEVPVGTYRDPFVIEPEYRLVVTNLNDRQVYDTVQEMTFQLVSEALKEDKNLFNLNELTKDSNKTYERLRTRVLQVAKQKENVATRYINTSQIAKSKGQKEFDWGTDKNGQPNKKKILSDEQLNAINKIRLKNRKLREDISESWPFLVEKHKEYMQSLNIKFDEGSQSQLDDVNKVRESNKFDASKIDNLKAASSTLKLLLSTIQIVNQNGKPIISSVNGSVLQPLSTTYIILMSELYQSTSPDDMITKLRDFAVNNLAYAKLYSRITGNDVNDGNSTPDLTKMTKQQSRIITALWRSFKKQAPEALNIFVFDDGTTVAPAQFSSAANQVRKNFMFDIASKSKSGKGLFVYNANSGKYAPKRKELDKINITNPVAMSNFFLKLGISFPVSEIRKAYRQGYKKRLEDVANYIKNSIADLNPISTFSERTLNISGRLQTLGFIKVAASNPIFDSTYRNVNGEKVQTFLGDNAADKLYIALKNAKNIDDLKGTPFSYLTTDVFAQGSNIISRMFASDGKKKANAEDLLRPGIAGGFVYENKKNISNTRLTDRERYAQQLNNNLAGRFMNLVPGDASLGHMVNMGTPVQQNQVSARGIDTVINTIFKEYLISEINLSRDNRPIPKVEYEKDTPEFEKRKTTDLRFFKDILPKDLHDRIVKDTDSSPQDLYKANKDAIVSATKDYIKGKVNNNFAYLESFELVDSFQVGAELVYNVKDVELPNQMNRERLVRELTAITINNMIAVIELHKLLYSDPYQYTQELKRTKSFLSPRQYLVSEAPAFLAQMNKIWNEGYQKGDIGYYNLAKDYFETVVHEDVKGVINLPNYKQFDETDGQGIQYYPAYRATRIKADNWNDAEEKQYRYEIAWEKRDKSIKRSPEEETLLKEGNPKVKSAFTPLKPIVAGNRLSKDGSYETFNNVVLHKYALYPLSYRVMKELNANNGVKLYDKMQREKVDYMVFASAEKVGNTPAHPTYKEGEFNNDEYTNKVNVPLSILAIQSEVPSKDKSLVTRGSQPTKLITLDMFDNGVPIDFKYTVGEEDGSREQQWNELSYEKQIEESDIFKEAENNTEILNAYTEQGYEKVLKRLGITDKEGVLTIVDRTEAAKTLRSEIFNRETNKNISDAILAFEKFGTSLETTPAYQPVRNILYSIVNKELVRPQVSGGQKVQISSALFESNRIAKKKINGNEGYTSNVLKFYEDEDGKRVMEVMVGRWFKSNMSDAKLMEYLNKTENQSILEAFGFRTPTQAQNSIDVIRVAKILPAEFGDSIVVPAAIVEKTGSDFDIDKFSIYLKNVFYVGGQLKEVPFYGTGANAKRKFADMFDSGKLFNSAQKKQLDALGQLKSWEVQGLINSDETVKKYGDLLAQLGVVEQEDSLLTFITELAEIGVRDTVIDRLYKQSLENGLTESSRNLASHKLNFENLITPNSADQLVKLSKLVAEKKGQAFDYNSVGNMLDNRFMLRLRQAFVSGKRAIGVVAVGQTGHSQNQRGLVTIDTSKIGMQPLEDRLYLSDAKIRFENYNTYEGSTSLSGRYNSNGDLISNINSQLMDGYVDITGKNGPWIMELGFTPQVASTVLFLNSIGVPIDQIAFFINQPAIQAYLKKLENNGKRWIYNEDYFAEVVNKYTGASLGIRFIQSRIEKDNFVIPSATTLENNIGVENFNKKTGLQQAQMLAEFLKYSRMAGQYYTVTVGTNFDTAVINDPFLILKKQVEYENAKNSIFSNIESRLEQGHVKQLGERLGILKSNKGNTRDGLANFLLSDKGNIRRVLESVLLPYTNLPNKDFVRVARKAVNSLFDWAVQTGGLNVQIEKRLLSDNSTAQQIMSIFDEIKNTKDPKDPAYKMRNNLVVDSMQVLPAGTGRRKVNNLKILNLGTKAYDVNSIIFSFKELKDYLIKIGEGKLYNDLVELSILQSGLSTSAISFTSYLPYADVSKVYDKFLPMLENMPNLDNFQKADMFQRNSWNDSDAVRSEDLYLITPANSNAMSASYPAIAAWARPKSVTAAQAKGEIPQTVVQLAGSYKSGDDFMVFNWSDLRISRAARAKMRKAGDYSYIRKGLFKLVKNPDGSKFTYTNPKTERVGYIYKAINALGDSSNANEYYFNARPSVIDNGFIKPTEASDAVVRSVWEGSYGRTIPTLEDDGQGYIMRLNDGKIMLADGKKYTPEVISDNNFELLKELGYSKKVIGNIIKIIKCR